MEILKDWDDLPRYMRLKEVRPYYEYLRQRKADLYIKRIFDILFSSFLLLVLSPLLLVLGILVTLDSPGGPFFLQERVTQYGRKFKIVKFRTMVPNAEKLGTEVTVGNDSRITRIGHFLRKYRLDEIPQLFNILAGDMTFVGTRPEVPKYVKAYRPEMMATLLLPAGVTSETSIRYKDESRLLEEASDADDVYINKILPEKMKINLESLRKFSCAGEVLTIFKTILALLRK